MISSIRIVVQLDNATVKADGTSASLQLVYVAAKPHRYSE